MHRRKFEDSLMRLYLFQLVNSFSCCPHPGGAGMLEQAPGRLFLNDTETKLQCKPDS